MTYFLKLVGITFLSLILTKYVTLPFLKQVNGYDAYLYVASIGVIIGAIIEFTNDRMRALVYFLFGFGIYLNLIYAGHFFLFSSFPKGVLLLAIGLTLIAKLAIKTRRNVGQ